MPESSRFSCLVCGQPSEPVFSAAVRGRFAARFARCQACGFVHAIAPDWLDMAYESAINETDLGLVSRSVRMARLTRNVVSGLLDPAASVLDYGGGYGITVRLLRDSGIDAWRWDPHCENLFAHSFESPADGKRRFDLVTAFEVAEHLPDPLATFADLFSRGENLFFSTSLLPDPLPAPGDWDYYGLEHGQHIAFYTLPALRGIARRHGKHLVSNGRNLHLMTAKPVPSWLFRLLISDRFSTLAGALIRRLPGRRRPSLLPSDSEAAISAAREEVAPPHPHGTKSTRLVEPVS